ncbi:MAG: DUF302 domain-containing protein [Calditrichales bacterium]|nr:MAG: DUF302 domain-containing protein [Calditrichales bacterium]
MKQTALGFSKKVDMEFAQALDAVKKGLEREGFSILTEVDVQKTMKNKLNVEFNPYTILGACNPSLSHEALAAEEQIGLMLPCKFIVYVNDNGDTVVAAIDPVKAMELVDNADLAAVAANVRSKFVKVLDSLK